MHEICFLHNINKIGFRVYLDIISEQHLVEILGYRLKMPFIP